MDNGCPPSPKGLFRRGFLLSRPIENQAMNEYQVTYSNGEVTVILAWTPEIAEVIAEEEAESHVSPGVSVVRVELLTAQEGA
jgi:hypothetical protein